ncbi:MAG TPA: hypothetical protein VMH87_09485 [Pseudomonadales bacterium]|nr:hypothetical protein [Pseudomonadales bacterium]
MTWVVPAATYSFLTKSVILYDKWPVKSTDFGLKLQVVGGLTVGHYSRLCRRKLLAMICVERQVLEHHTARTHMLNLNHPQSKHIFAASRFEDAVLEHAKKMTLVPSVRRRELLIECQQQLNKMRTLNAEHFENSPFIFEAIDELGMSLIQLAELRHGSIVEDRSIGDGCCAACETPITNIVTVPSMPRSIYCSPCLEIIMPALSKLRSRKGFGTDFI